MKKENYVPREGIIRWNSSNEKMYILKSKDGDYPCWEEIDPFKDLCDARGEKASAVLRELAYQYAETHADGEDYKDAESEDMRLMNKAQESRIANGFNWTKKCED